MKGITECKMAILVKNGKEIICVLGNRKDEIICDTIEFLCSLADNFSYIHLATFVQKSGNFSYFPKMEAKEFLQAVAQLPISWIVDNHTKKVTAYRYGRRAIGFSFKETDFLKVWDEHLTDLPYLITPRDTLIPRGSADRAFQQKMLSGNAEFVKKEILSLKSSLPGYWMQYDSKNFFELTFFVAKPMNENIPLTFQFDKNIAPAKWIPKFKSNVKTSLTAIQSSTKKHWMNSLTAKILQNPTEMKKELLQVAICEKEYEKRKES